MCIRDSLGTLFQKMRGTNPQRGVSVISALIAIAILGLLAAMTSKLLVQQSSVSAASDLDYERDFMRRYIREGLNCCETLKPWMTSLKNARPLDPVATPPVPFTNCNSLINEEASPTILRHVNDKSKNSVHPLVDDGKLIAQVINFGDDDNAYSFGRWKFAIRCNEDSGRMFLTINSWRIGLDSRTGNDLSLSLIHISEPTRPY